MPELINPDEYKVVRVEGPEDLLEEFHVRERHPDAEIVVTEPKSGNQPVIMCCPYCKKTYGRQVRVKIIEAYNCVGWWVFDVVCVEGHVDTVEIEKAEGDETT